MSELQTLIKDAQGPAGRRLLLFALAAAAIVMPWLTGPRIRPPMTLAARISIAATASPFTNFDEPSIAP